MQLRTLHTYDFTDVHPDSEQLFMDHIGFCFVWLQTHNTADSSVCQGPLKPLRHRRSLHIFTFTERDSSTEVLKGFVAKILIN